jgi:hypothetical protein
VIWAFGNAALTRAKLAVAITKSPNQFGARSQMRRMLAGSNGRPSTAAGLLVVLGKLPA